MLYRTLIITITFLSLDRHARKLGLVWKQFAANFDALLKPSEMEEQRGTFLLKKRTLLSKGNVQDNKTIINNWSYKNPSNKVSNARISSLPDIGTSLHNSKLSRFNHIRPLNLFQVWYPSYSKKDGQEKYRFVKYFLENKREKRQWLLSESVIIFYGHASK